MASEIMPQHAPNALQFCSSNRGVACEVVENADLNPDVIDASDAVFSAGGDGIFLMAANKVVDRNKPVIGINTGK